MANKKINQLTELSIPDNNDLLIVDDVSAGETKKITFQNLSERITTSLSQSITASLAAETTNRTNAINSAISGLASITYVNSALSGTNATGTSPGGSSGQIQYNNSGSFGGVTNLTWNGAILNATGSFKGNLDGTASYATNAGNALTASFVQQAVSASFATSALTASYVLNAVSSSFATSALTASYVLNAVSSSFATNALTASYVLQAVSASYATNSLSASYASTALTASYILNAVSASFTTIALTASYVQQAVSASYATVAVSLTTNVFNVALNGTANGVATNIGALYIPASTTVTTKSLAYIGGSTVSEVAVLKMIPINSVTVSASWAVTGTLKSVSLTNPTTLGQGWYDLILETGTTSQTAFGRGLYLTSGDI